MEPESAPIQAHLISLISSGIGGAYFRAVFAPQVKWRRRILEGSAGVVCAVSLGGILGEIINTIIVKFGGAPSQYAYLAAAFFMGEGGLAVVHGLRRLLLRGTDNE